MKKNKKNKIGVNVSSGAEKVEEIAKNAPTAGVNSTVGGGFAYNGAINENLNGDFGGNGTVYPAAYVADNTLASQNGKSEQKSEEQILLEKESRRVRLFQERRKQRCLSYIY